MGKRGGRTRQKNDVKKDKTSSRYEPDAFSSDDMDDEIDAFHKQRDIVPLDVNDGGEESDEDDELPIFDNKDIDNDEDDDEDEDNDESDDDDSNDDVAKIIRQRKYLRAKFGEGEDEMEDDDDEDEENYKLTLGGKKFSHGAENRNFEIQSSDDEAPKEEEELALQMQREKAKSLTLEDFDLVDITDDKDIEKTTLKDASNGAIKSLDRDLTFVVEDLNALSKEEQMNVLYRSAPELVGLMSELNEAHNELECKINPFLSKVKKGEIIMEGGVRYFELKQLLLLSYCQAITFYLLLKSEGQPVHDHPVMTRLEEIKKLLDQIKQLDTKLPVELEDILKGNNGLERVVKSDNDNAPTATDSITKNQEHPLVSAESPEVVVPNQVVETQKLESSKDSVQKARKVKHQDHIGLQSLEMLKVRASLEEKLKQKGLYGSIAPKPSSTVKRLRPVNGQLETYDDFDDDAVDVKGAASNGPVSSKVSKFLNANLKKPKVVSGDDDLPKKDDIGERRRKHELRVLAGAGIKTEDDDDDDDDQTGDPGTNEVADEMDDVESGDSENEFYEQVQQVRAAKLAAKAQTYSRNTAVPFLPETVEGKRYISSQMEKNRGLTRTRNKEKKNPRKNYKLKHQKAVKNRKGQVQSIRKPTAPYGGESTGINAGISRSIRF
ncbi:protein THALLO isoform X2 [Gastrolobium bilobum]|uniref:protein THALLO isoform X2 n=1 Tax=Gastrolobium bilobum TaxID=150636 RepID=UPI002AB00D64|nr:protein THALLO isoform X2 [Gastrolobium bilobum]